MSGRNEATEKRRAGLSAEFDHLDQLDQKLHRLSGGIEALHAIGEAIHHEGGERQEAIYFLSWSMASLVTDSRKALEGLQRAFDARRRALTKDEQSGGAEVVSLPRAVPRDD